MNVILYFTFILIVIIYNAGIISTTLYTKQCHNYYAGKNEDCFKQSFSSKVTCDICKDTGSRNATKLTICKTVEFHTGVDDILKAVPLHTEYLLIDFDNVWNGYLPLQPDPINITSIARLKNLKYFQISDKKFQYFQLYPIFAEKHVLRSLRKLHTFRIRIPVIDNQNYTVSEMVKDLQSLEFLDFSYTRGLGNDTVSNILYALNNTQIKCICLRKFQLPGAKYYSSDFSKLIQKMRQEKIKFHSLKELDISYNAIARMSSGITRIFPSLTILDISGNSLLDGSNMALFAEIIFHPEIQMANMNYQGCDHHSYFRPYQHNDLSRTVGESSGILGKESFLGDTEIIPALDLEESKDELRNKQVFFLVTCANWASKGNVTYIFLNKTMSCLTLVCLLPSLFSDLVCDKETPIPELSEIYRYECMLFIKIPLGRNLKAVYFSNVHFEQAQTVGAALSGELCFLVNNTIEELQIDNNNLWMDSSQLSKTFQNMTTIKHLDKLKLFSFSNNKVLVDLSPSFRAILPSVETFNLSGNNVNNWHYCMLVPNVVTLDLRATNLTFIHPTIVQNCSNLQNLYLGGNPLNVSSLTNLNLSGTTNLKYIDLEGSNIHFLEETFLQKLDTYPNLTINLAENPLSCNCSKESMAFTKWLIHKGNATLAKFSSYYCSGPGGLTFIEHISHTHNFWYSCYPYDIIVGMVLTLSIICFLGCIITLYRIRWRLRYMIFRLQQSCYCCFCKSKTETYIWKYDAYVSYCSTDRFWVHDTLMKTLENIYGFKLCIHFRDFPVGEDVAETISEHMSQSREIIIIISNYASKNRWCQFALNEALRQALQHNKQLIIIKIGELTQDLLSPKLAYVLDNSTLLEWPENNKKKEKHFWNVLRANLYNDPYAYSCNFCAYQSKSSGYQKLINSSINDDWTVEDEEEDNDLSEKDRKSVQECTKKIKNAQRKIQQTVHFKESLEQDLRTDNLPHWAFGPTPYPIEQLLMVDKEILDQQIHTHAEQRVELLMECLSNQYNFWTAKQRQGEEELKRLKTSLGVGNIV